MLFPTIPSRCHAIRLNEEGEPRKETPDDIPDLGTQRGAPLIDSASTYHITGDPTRLFDLRSCEVHAVEVADGRLITGDQMGKMMIDELNNVVLENVAYAPGFSQTLISVKRLMDSGMKVEFTESACNVYGPPIMQGTATRGVYALKPPACCSSSLAPELNRGLAPATQSPQLRRHC